jgi:SNF2 family DNA or RNA helicase
VAHAEREGSIIAVTVPALLSNRIKQVPGARFNASENRWHLPLAWSSCLALRGVFGDELSVGDALADWSRNEFERRILPSLKARLETDAEGDPDLLPFQRAGVAFLVAAERALLRDEPQLGKTVQSLRAVTALGPAALPVLVVCPSSLRYKWAEEVTKWTSLRPSVADGDIVKKRKAVAAVQSGDADVLILNWESLKSLSRIAPFESIALKAKEKEPKELNSITWGTVIADEAHRAKDPRTLQSRALKAAADGARYRFALTATPVANNVGDLWSIMNFVSPEEWPSRPAWVDRYCEVAPNWFGGIGSMEIIGLKPTTQEELMRFLEPRMLGRTRAAVLAQVPETVEEVREVEMSTTQARGYKAMKEEMMAALDSGALLVASDPMVQALRLRQFANATVELDEAGNVILKEPSCKVDALMELLDERGGRPTVVFTESSKLLRLASARLEREGVKHFVIDGHVSAAERDLARQEFQKGEVPAILLTIGAGGEGLTLTAADVLVFLQQSFSYVKMTQARDRIQGIAQLATKLSVISFVTHDTVESQYALSLSEKERQSLQTSRDPELWRKLLGSAVASDKPGPGTVA